MSDPNAPDELPEAVAGPHRVIGTPPPAQARTLLGEVSGDGRERRPAPRELPADPPNPRRAKKAERIVAALLILSTLAGIGCIPAYFRPEGGSVGAVFRSPPAPRLSVSVVFLALAAGRTISVRP